MEADEASTMRKRIMGLAKMNVIMMTKEGKEERVMETKRNLLLLHKM